MSTPTSTPQKTPPRKVALVTGGTRGIGRHVSLELSARGYFIAMNYLSNREKAESTLAEILASGGAGALYQADVTKPDQVQAMVKSIAGAHRRIDALVNNAGVTRDNVFMMMTADNWSKVMDTNLNSVFHCCKAVVRYMIAQKSGVIINIGSGSGLSPRVGQANYSTTKSAIIGFTRSLAREVANNGVRVVTVAPGFTRTEMADSVSVATVAESLRMIPMGRWGMPEEIAKVVGFAVSDDASYLNAVTIVVDGGRAGAEQDFGIIT